MPDKLQKFYADTNIVSDPYPWQGEKVLYSLGFLVTKSELDIFDDRTSSISRLFRDIEAEHHLVQAKLDERPDIPGLTPRGFEVFATLMIQAHPDKEYERLQKAVLNMPISNPDNRKERFPKEIPRRLFPETPNLRLRDVLDQHIMKHCGVELPPITDEEIDKVAAQRHKSSASPAVSIAESSHPPSHSVYHSANERDKKGYHPPSVAVVDDEDEEQSPPAIERTRKPYSANPGKGVYARDRNQTAQQPNLNCWVIYVFITLNMFK